MAEMSAISEGVRLRREYETRTAMTIAWLTAAMMRADKLPPLEKITGEKRRQTQEERAGLMARWAAAVNAQGRMTHD